MIAIGEHESKLKLSGLRKNNLNKVIFAHLNINSIRKKFDQVADSIEGNVVILMISESKIADSFPYSQFLLKSYCTFLSV